MKKLIVIPLMLAMTSHVGCKEFSLGQKKTDKKSRADSGVYSRKDSSSDKTEFDFERIVYRDVLAQKGDRYYRSGTFTVEMNDWKGEVVNSGASSGPKYALSRGSEVVSGTYAYNPGQEDMNLSESPARTIREMRRDFERQMLEAAKQLD
jgi:hypothetical protein